MNPVDGFSRLGPELASALAKKGYTKLTPVQEAVLDPALSTRDLRISSQTGSGKTLAIGFALKDVALAKPRSAQGLARPGALVVAPTRELAKQVELELGWLFAPLGVRVVSVTGGASYRDEQRALGAGPAIVVGTPGRLLDHLRRGTIDPSALAAVVLDEADRMLDLGFRDDLEAILALAPEEHRTHLVSATFAREVRALADRVQRDPVHVQGTPLGTANTDIDHVVHLVPARERVNALVNLLLAEPDAQTLVFARTRADVARVADELRGLGFAVDSLSGEMEQNARNRALGAFKRGDLHVLVATDVAARGIDHQEIARVIQIDPPNDADTYTHRSGRTGRAGRKGTSATLVPPSALPKLSALLRRAGVRFQVAPVPTAEALFASQDERLFAELTRDLAPADEPDARAAVLAARLAESGHSTRALARLIALTRRSGRAEPRQVSQVELGGARAARNGSAVREQSRDSDRDVRERSRDSHRDEPRAGADAGWVGFRVSWGQAHGADARRLMAMLCRRGNLRGSDIGAIRVGPAHSIVEVRSDVAEGFERATHDADPRDPRVTIRRERTPAQSDEARPRRHDVVRPHGARAEPTRAHAAPQEPARPRPSAARPEPTPVAARSRPHVARPEPTRPPAAPEPARSRPHAARQEPTRPPAARGVASRSEATRSRVVPVLAARSHPGRAHAGRPQRAHAERFADRSGGAAPPKKRRAK